MKTPLLALVLAFGFAAALSAETYNYLNLTSSSTVQSVALKTVKKITFEGTNIVVTTANGTTTTAPLSNLTKLTFTGIAVGVNALKAESGKLCIEGGRVVADGQGQLQLFNASGQLVRRQTVTRTHCELSLDGLPRGIYIARFGQKTIKILY